MHTFNSNSPDPGHLVNPEQNQKSESNHIIHSNMINEIKFSDIQEIPTTLEGLSISSGDTLFDNKYLFANNTIVNKLSIDSTGLTKEPIPGSIEFDGQEHFFTNGDSIRQRIAPSITSQLTVTGSTAGRVVFGQPFQTISYKKVIINVIGLKGDVSYQYPKMFSYTPIVIGSSIDTGIITSINNSGLTITGIGNSGFIILEGY